MTARTLFVTGTDTAVGKTRVACALIRAARGQGIRVCGWKPVATGCERAADGLRNADALALQAAAGTREPYERLNPFAYAPAVAPHLAPFLWMYWKHSRRQRHAQIARLYSRLIEHCVAEHEALRGELQVAGVDPGELEEVVDHPHHPVDLGADLPVVARRVLGQAVLQRLGHGPHPGQRTAQVVGDPRDQLAPGLLQACLPFAGLRELPAGPHELVGELLELRGSRGSRDELAAFG